MATILLKLELPLLVAAGIIGQKTAAKLWSRVFRREVPNTSQENVRIVELLPVAVVEGTFYKLARMAVDRSLRVAASRSEGVWLGEAGSGE